MQENHAKMDALARRVLRQAHDTLLIHLRYLDVALSRLKPVSSPGLGYSLATDGMYLLYDAPQLLRQYREAPAETVRSYLHALLHCVFTHFVCDAAMERAWWDLACDIAVEAVLSELELPCIDAPRAAMQQSVFAQLRADTNHLTAEKLYARFRSDPPPVPSLEAMQQLFAGDDHDAWYALLLPQTPLSDDAPSDGAPEGEAQNDARQRRQEHQRQQLCEQWQDVARRMQTARESFEADSPLSGEGAGTLLQNLRDVTRDRIDYTAFLRRFAVTGEMMRVSEDEFDCILYTYGMDRYGNMPLVEPLETREVKRIRDLVIAIDTSGSVMGEKVQDFLQRTYSILCQEESFFTKINVYIIQCDAEVQEVRHIKSREDFEEYLHTMTLHGFGGTDFRPVFAYVDELRKSGILPHLKALLYFTDGYGIFPKRKPEYQTAFVFSGQEELPPVPAWAISLRVEDLKYT